jgi:hypothetical protein
MKNLFLNLFKKEAGQKEVNQISDLIPKGTLPPVSIRPDFPPTPEGLAAKVATNQEHIWDVAAYRLQNGMGLYPQSA